jgi:hypothetical protein
MGIEGAHLASNIDHTKKIEKSEQKTVENSEDVGDRAFANVASILL